jgi:hypothetical protein
VRSVRWSSVLLFTLAAPLAAKSVYIPFAGQAQMGGLAAEVRVAITNVGSGPATIERLFLPTNTDGTQRAAEPLSQEVAAGQTVVLVQPAGQTGLLEISGPDAVVYRAYLAVVGDPTDTLPLPVIDAGNSYAAGESLDLQAMPRDPARPTALTLVNLGHAAAVCSAAILDQAGAEVAPPATLGLAALSHRLFPNVLATLGGGGDVRVRFDCDQPHFAYALLGGGQSERLALVLPAQRANFGIEAGSGGPAACPAGATCFDRLGVVHAPTPANPVRRFVIPVPSGTYRRIRLRLDVRHGGWSAARPDGRHSLFWLVNTKNLNMYGNGDLYGPSASYLDLQHGVGLVHEDKIHLVQPLVAQPGATYHLDYVYDVGARFVELVVTRAGAQVARVRGVPNVSQIGVAAGDQILLDIGFDGSNPFEPPTFGWTYSNLEVDFER